MSNSLVIMAAGIGSRFGSGKVKQLTPVGPNGELLMEYAIHDALAAGFDKVIFIIREDIEKEFRKLIGDKIAGHCKVEYAFQKVDDLPVSLPEDFHRTKPWGTGQAVLAARHLIDGPFAVINADDYYGKDAFGYLMDFISGHKETEKIHCLIGYILQQTVSYSGPVTRGICNTALREDGHNYLVEIQETKGVMPTEDGRIVDENGSRLHPESLVSMNMWGFTEDFMKQLETGFRTFLEEHIDDEKGEFLIPTFVKKLLLSGDISVKVYETKAKWLGMTYGEDRDDVTKEFAKMVRDGVYESPLFVRRK